MRVLALSALSIVATSSPLAAEDLGPAFAGFALQSFAGFETPSGQLFEVGAVTGTLDFENDAAVLEHAAIHCVSEFQANSTGHCAFVTLAGAGSGSATQSAGTGGNEAHAGENDLNHLWASNTCQAAPPENIPPGVPAASQCTFTVIEGDGVFEGATGTATAIVAGDLVRHPDGSWSGFANFTSFDLTLKQ